MKQQLLELGYHSMPQNMQANLLAKIKNENFILDKTENPSPFALFDNSQHYLSLSKNKFPEIIPEQSFLHANNQGNSPLLWRGAGGEVDPVSFALSIDPFSYNFPF